MFQGMFEAYSVFKQNLMHLFAAHNVHKMNSWILDLPMFWFNFLELWISWMILKCFNCMFEAYFKQNLMHLFAAHNVHKMNSWILDLPMFWFNFLELWISWTKCFKTCTRRIFNLIFSNYEFLEQYRNILGFEYFMNRN